MSLANRRELQRLCSEIETLVKGEDLDVSYNQGGVRVTVFSGTRAMAEGAFINAMKTYMRAKRSATSAEEREKAKEAFLHAFDDYVKAMSYSPTDV
jgi:hypothetical protein